MDTVSANDRCSLLLNLLPLGGLLGLQGDERGSGWDGMILMLSDDDEAPTAPSQLIWAIPGLLMLSCHYLLGRTRIASDRLLRVVKVMLGDVAPALGSHLPERVVQAAVEARRGAPCRTGRLIMLPITRSAFHRRRTACRR